MRTADGETSTHSSSAQNSRACSRLSSRGGTSRSSSSPVDWRTLVTLRSRQMLTSISSDREFSPTIMPSYTSVPGDTNSEPRSCRLNIAYAAVLPERSATSDPDGRVRRSPDQGS